MEYCSLASRHHHDQAVQSGCNRYTIRKPLLLMRPQAFVWRGMNGTRNIWSSTRSLTFYVKEVQQSFTCQQCQDFAQANEGRNSRRSPLDNSQTSIRSWSLYSPSTISPTRRNIAYRILVQSWRQHHCSTSCRRCPLTTPGDHQRPPRPPSKAVSYTHLTLPTKRIV